MCDLTANPIDSRLAELLRIAIGVDTAMASPCTSEEWSAIYQRAKEHAVGGLIYKAVSLLPREQMPNADIIGQLFSDAQYIRIQNVKVHSLYVRLQEKFRKDGFRTAILKGAGNALLYRPTPDAQNAQNGLGTYRLAGDVDIWLIADGCTSIAANRKAVIEYVRSFASSLEARVHHVELPPIDGIPVEVHYLPIFFYSFRTQRKFERFCLQQAQRQTSHQYGDLFVPTPDFNAVYQLSHILRHLFEEGIGLKQIVDYYFVIRALHNMPSDDTQHIDVLSEIESLGMQKLAAAMMWVLNRLFALPDEYMICPSDEFLGQMLLKEIMHSGYMGNADKRISAWRHNGRMSMFFWKLKFNMRLWPLCPREVLCGPIFRIWHYGWRRKNGYINAS